MKAGSGTILQLEAASRDLGPKLSSWCTPSRRGVMAFYLQYLKGCTAHLCPTGVSRNFRSLQTRRCLGWMFLQLLLSCGIYLHWYIPYLISQLLLSLKLLFEEFYILALMEHFHTYATSPPHEGGARIRLAWSCWPCRWTLHGFVTLDPTGKPGW